MAQASAEKLEHTGPAEKSSLGATERAVGKYARAAFSKRKRAFCPKHQIVWWEIVKMSEGRNLARERGESEREHGEERVDFTVTEGRFKEEREEKH